MPTVEGYEKLWHAASARRIAADQEVKRLQGIKYGLVQRSQATQKKLTETATAAYVAICNEKDASAKPLLSQGQNLRQELGTLKSAIAYSLAWLIPDAHKAAMEAEIIEYESHGSFLNAHASAVQQIVAEKVSEILEIDPGWELKAGMGEKNAESEKLKLEAQTAFTHAGTLKARLETFIRETETERLSLTTRGLFAFGNFNA